MLLWKIGLMCSLWCFFHSLMVTHAWDRFLQRALPKDHALGRLAYVACSAVTWFWLMIWIHGLPHSTLWAWPGAWAILRWTGLLLALLLFRQGSLVFDNGTFLGLSQWRAWRKGAAAPEPPFRQTGILRRIRHPWYAGALLFFAFCLPVTDINAVWRGVFILYTLIGTELEERKLLRDLGPAYAAYREQVPRYLPHLR